MIMRIHPVWRKMNARLHPRQFVFTYVFVLIFFALFVDRISGQAISVKGLTNKHRFKAERHQSYTCSLPVQSL